MEQIQLSDGRTLAYDVHGDPDGTPVIFNHGFSDSRLIRHPDEGLTRSIGIRVIAVDQPGVGGSTPKNKRRMVDWGADMEELADHLGLARFAVAGHSGGGAHALSIHRMPERITSDSDTFLADPDQRAMFEASFAAGMQQGGEGMYEMIMALLGWGFAPEDITMHVELFNGDADDILDPKVPRHVAERLPDCTTHVWEGAGHCGFVDRERWTQFLGAAARRGAAV